MILLHELKKRTWQYFLFNLDIIIFFLLITVKSRVYLKLLSGGTITSSAKYSIFASVLIVMGFAVLFKHKSRMIFLYSLNLLISVIIIMDINYFRYFKDVISINSLRNLSLLTGVKDSVANIIKLSDLLYLVDSILLLPVILLFRRNFNISLKIGWRLLVFALLATSGSIMQYKYIAKLSIDQPGLLSSMRNKLYITKYVGNLSYHGIDIYNVINSQIQRSISLPESRKEQIQSVFSTINNNGENLKGSAEGKNLIMIQVESLQQFVINSKVNGAYVTPNLNKWINKSLYFDNFFTQVAAGNTSDAEFLTNNSLYPAATGAAYSLFARNSLNSIASEFKEKGYYTAALHGYNEVFWNRNVMYPAEGFEDFYSASNYNQDEAIGMGLSDKSFLTQTVDKLKSFKQPYYSFIITLTSHYPFDGGDKYGNFDVGEYKNTTLGNYFRAIHYTDEQLGLFLNMLKQTGIMDNSIIVLYGDHAAIPQNDKELLFKFVNEKNKDDFQWYQYQKVPFTIHFPGDLNKGINNLYSGEIDTYPTIANLFNLTPDFTLGKDLFNSTDGKVIFRNGSFTDGNIYYLSSSDSYYHIKTGQKLQETDEMKKIKNSYLTDLQISDDLLNKNLIKEFEQKQQ
jgi:lipoteichoic acid synthase